MARTNAVSRAPATTANVKQNLRLLRKQARARQFRNGTHRPGKLSNLMVYLISYGYSVMLATELRLPKDLAQAAPGSDLENFGTILFPHRQ